MYKYIFSFTCLIFCAFPVVSQKTTSPNVIIILMDDLGYGDFESYGGASYVTPQVTKMVSEGMRFTHFYAAQATCSASRAALLTGTYPNRIGINGALFPWSEIAINPKEETLAEILKQKGYRTGMVGKWHLGQEEPYLPLQHGFDEYLGLPYSNDMWPVDFDGSPITDSSNERAKYPPLPLIEGNEKVKIIETLEDQAGLTSLYTDRAIDFIQKNEKNPFFLYVAHSMPHVPIAASDKYKGKSEAGMFGDVMMELDWSIGRIIETLEESNLSEETIVILTSDNGPWLNYGNHAGNTAGLREGKGTSWEGGVRVPAIIRWPGTIPAGTVCNKIASTIDILPTIANFCGAELPAKKIDGVDISALWLNEENANPRDEFVYYYDENSLQAIRKDEWKLVFPHEYRTYKKNLPGWDGWPGEQPMDTAEFALYNLRTDPGETLNLKEKFPDIVRELEGIANRYRKELGDDLTGVQGNERRPPAKLGKN